MTHDQTDHRFGVMLKGLGGGTVFASPTFALMEDAISFAATLNTELKRPVASWFQFKRTCDVIDLGSNPGEEKIVLQNVPHSEGAAYELQSRIDGDFLMFVALHPEQPTIEPSDN